LDLEPAANDDERELVGGLSRDPKHISPKYFYDETGSKLFEQICEQPEYYPTRTELGIMKQNIDEITALCGPRASVIEFGSGSSLKTRLLLEHLVEPAAYVPVDISRDRLLEAAEELAGDYPDIEVLPVRADFTRPFELPQPKVMPERNIVYFPGSTIGNFQNPEAVALLRVMREESRNDGALLIGVDLEKPKDVVEPAYNDAAGVTADFNLNVLRRLNREYDATFDLEAFRHHALFDDDNSRIEMRLISLKHQAIHVAGERFELDEGEYIVTEHSHKYAPEQFARMAEEAGFSLEQVWTDRDEMFSVQFLVAN
jgi:dimethylhistidine N-methyltransferase